MRKLPVYAIIDDDEIFRFLGERKLTCFKIANKVITFSNGAEAISHFKKFRNKSEQLPDVILLDVFMPILNGPGFLNEFLNLKSSLSKEISIYVISSFLRKEEKEQFPEGVSGFLQKPLDDVVLTYLKKEIQ